jgi:hypothetical protein
MRDAVDNTSTKDETMTTATGRNGFEYDAKHIKDDFYIVGVYIVRVIDGRCVETMCRATKKYIVAFSN